MFDWEKFQWKTSVKVRPSNKKWQSLAVRKKVSQARESVDLFWVDDDDDYDREFLAERSSYSP